MSDGWYFNGLGLLSGIVVTLGVGLAANLFLLCWVVRFAESILERIALVASLFQAFQDIARLFSKDDDEQLGQVVAVEIDGSFAAASTKMASRASPCTWQ